MANESNYDKLDTKEKIQVSAFLKKHAEFCTEPGRQRHFMESAASELLYIRDVNERRVAEGKDPLTSDETELTVPVAGVIKSVHRAKEEAKLNADAIRSERNNLLEIAGLGQDRD